MATNYDTPQSKASVKASLTGTDSNLTTDIANKILKSLGKTVHVNEILSTDPIPVGADLKGLDIVLIDQGGVIDLSTITKAEIKGVNALMFSTADDVTLTLGSVDAPISFNGVVTTEEGNDTITINSSIGVTVSSGNGNDTVTTGKGNDSVNAGAGDDSVTTGLGNDTVNAGAGNDSVDTGAGNDSVSTGLGNDTVSTGLGNDTVYVGSGSDSIETGAGNDIVKLAAGFTGGEIDYDGANVVLDGGDGTKDTLDLRLVHITSVEDQSGSAGLMQAFTITLDNGTIIDAKNFEKFIYDSSTTDTDGSIQIVGAHEFHTHDFGG